MSNEASTTPDNEASTAPDDNPFQKWDDNDSAKQGGRLIAREKVKPAKKEAKPAKKAAKHGLQQPGQAPRGDGEVRPDPFVANQKLLFPQHTHVQAAQWQYFELPKQLDAFNEVLAMGHPRKAPKAVVDIIEKREKTDTGWEVLVSVSPIMYSDPR